MSISPLLKLLNAQTELARKTPLMAPLILNLDFRADESIQTCATAENCTTYFNPTYVAGMEGRPGMENLEKVLYHEVLHLFLDYFGRRGHRDNLKWNVAHDLELAAEVQPTDCLTPERFKLPPGLLGERYYDMLPQPQQIQVQPCGHHLVAGREQRSDSTRQAIIESAEQVVKSGGRGAGQGLLKQALAIVRPAHGNEQLRQIQGALLCAGDSDFSYERPNRRTGGRRDGPILPALIHRDARIMAVLDVSGSMSGRTEVAAKALLGAVKCVGSGLDVVAWDTQPQAVCNVRTARDLAKLCYSGGGTDMAAAIRYCAKRGRYDALFVITDCDTEWPDASEARRLPPIYVLRVGTTEVPCKWMRVIQAD